MDDEPIVCNRLKPMLEKSGCRVEIFTDSKASLERLSEKKFDILITDLKMKPPDGIELLHFTRNTYPETRVIFITGFATTDTARDALKGGAVDFIAKPFHMSQLRDLVLKISADIQQG
ncbi:MAG TPA: response regulator [Anaerolineales bacterium]|nr:response regulator [Anaerolineales bacterium]